MSARITTSLGAVEFPTHTGAGAAVRTAESGTRSEATTPTSGLVTVLNSELHARYDSSRKMLLDSAFDIETVSDPNTEQDADRLVQNMVRFILEGISPVDEAPEVPAEYWEKLQRTTEQRITLAGYRIADLVISAADNITAQRRYIGR